MIVNREMEAKSIVILRCWICDDIGANVVAMIILIFNRSEACTTLPVLIASFKF